MHLNIYLTLKYHVVTLMSRTILLRASDMMNFNFSEVNHNGNHMLKERTFDGTLEKKEVPTSDVDLEKIATNVAFVEVAQK